VNIVKKHMNELMKYFTFQTLARESINTHSWL